MGLWYDQARIAAARAAGRRYWRWMLAAHLLRSAAPAIAAIGAVAVVGALIWLSVAVQAAWIREAIHLAILMRWAALAGLLVWLGWLLRDAITGAGITRRIHGQRRALPALLLLSSIGLFTASLLIR